MSKTITRKYIQRITRNENSTSIRRSSGGGGGGGGVSQYWVDDNYVSKEFFNRLFEIHDENGDPILPNDVETEIDNIQAMFGFWTNAYLSALGQNEGGGGAELTLASLADVAVQGVTDGQALVWSASQGKWVPGEGGGGLDPTAMWAELATTGTQQINKTHLTTALADYLPLAGGTMTSTSLVTNMNADLLDGHHAADFALASAISDMATQTWVSTNYLSKTDATSTYLTKTEANTTYLSISFFRALFRAYTSGGSEVVPNDGSTSTIDNIKAMFGFWTNSYLSALGNNPGGASLTLSSLSDVSISGATAGQVLTYRNGTWRNETPQGGGGSVTSIVTGGTTYSPTNGVVTLPDNIVYDNDNANYLGASFLKSEYSQKAAQKYIEFWDSAGGWFNFMLGTLYAVSDVKVGNNSVIHEGNIGSQSVSYATTAGSTNLLDGHHAADFALASAITDMATQTWVSTNYLSKTDATSTYLTKTDANNTYLSIAFFRALFRAYTSGGSEVVPNDGSTSTIDNIKAMFGFWTNSYLSAIGNNPGGASLTLSSLSDVSISGATAGQVLTYRNGTWRNETPQGGGTDMQTVWQELAATGTQQINASHLTTALSDFVTIDTQQTISGIKTFSNMVFLSSILEPSDGNGLLVYKPSPGWSGISSLQWGVGAADSQGVIRSSNTNLLHYKGGTSYTIWDESNDGAGSGLDADLLDGRHATDFAYGTNGIADSASALANKTVTASTLNGLSGSFTFEGNELTTSGYNEVGIQVGSSVDKFQIIGKSGTLLVRQNDNGGTSTSGWSGWTMLPTKVFTKHQLTKTDQWYRVANLTTYGLSYIISIGENYYNREPTPATFIINTSYTNATITQIGRAALTPVSITKVRLVKYGNGTFHVEVYTPKLSGSSSASMNMPKVNIFNLGRENTSDGIALVHDPNDDTKWLEVDKNIASGETLIEEATISTESYATSLKTSRSLWGHAFDGTADVKGTLSDVTSIEMNSDGSLSGFGGFIDFHYNGSSANYTSRIIESASGRLVLNNVLNIINDGNVGIGTTSPAYKLDVNGDVQATNFRGNFVGNADSATKLQTARTIWGQSFDGSANVSGAITGATTISASSNVSVGGTLSVSGTSTLTGHVGIGTSPHSTYVLRANGEVYVSTGLYSHGYVTALSDIRHKDVMGDVKLTVSEVANAPAVKFLWKDRRQEGLQVGSIAQYWKKVLPEAIVEAADGELTMSYGVIALLASIANAREIVNLKREIAELKRTLSNHGILE